MSGHGGSTARLAAHGPRRQDTMTLGLHKGGTRQHFVNFTGCAQDVTGSLLRENYKVLF